MKTEALRALQAPLKQTYRETPGAALVTLRAEGDLGEGITCRVETGKAFVEAGLHPATGGDGLDGALPHRVSDPAQRAGRTHFARGRIGIRSVVPFEPGDTFNE